MLSSLVTCTTLYKGGYMVVGDEEVPWKLADSTAVSITQTELKKVLVLAGQIQASVWLG